MTLAGRTKKKLRVIVYWPSSCISMMWRKEGKQDSQAWIYPWSLKRCVNTVHSVPNYTTHWFHLNPYLVSFSQGRALVWPSVMNDDPDATDSRMYHEAKAVIKGTKYAANHWSKCSMFYTWVVFSKHSIYVANDIIFVVQFTNMTLEMPIFGDAMVALLKKRGAIL